ncbi:unnamed protein product, partial [Ixodes persulcatus]
RQYLHPSAINTWDEDMKKWPGIRGPDIIYYLLHSKACDLESVKAYKSLDSFNYLQSGWVGTILAHKIDTDMTLLKAKVQASQSCGKFHNAWVCAKPSGEVITGGCSCMAGQAKVCSHVGAILWKVDMAVAGGLTGEACTDTTSTWNRGTKRNVEPALLETIGFKLQKRTVDDMASNKKPALP